MYLKVHFQSFPTIRHSHYFSKRNYTVRYHHNNTIEIAYIVNGTLHVLKDGNELLTVSPGDFFIFSSNQSLTLISDPNIMHIHHTIQLQCDHQAELYDGEYTESSQPEHCFILPMCMKCDESHKTGAERFIFQPPQRMMSSSASIGSSLLATTITLSPASMVSSPCG